MEYVNEFQVCHGAETTFLSLATIQLRLNCFATSFQSDLIQESDGPAVNMVRVNTGTRFFNLESRDVYHLIHRWTTLDPKTIRL